MKAVIYVRVSTDEQNPENQILFLNNFAKSRGIEVIGTFVDPGISGYETKPEEREGWRKAVEAAKNNGAAIIVFSLDRIARRYDYLVKTLDELRENNIHVIAYQEEWLQSLAAIPDEALRKLIFDIVVRALAYGYQKYVESLREKIKAGMERAKKEGKHVGRPPAVPDEFLIKIIRKYPYLSKKDLWKMARAEGYEISYPRFVRRVNEVIKKYGLEANKK